MWYQSLLGGIIIGISASLNLYMKGRILGMSGLLSGILKLDQNYYWRLSQMSGMICCSIIGWVYQRELVFDKLEDYYGNNNSLSWNIGGLLVGMGTRMANGCTSGHGVCGLPRFSLRSLVAVMTFMIVAITLATLRSHYPFFITNDMLLQSQQATSISLYFILSTFLLIFFIHLIYYIFTKQISNLKDALFSFLIGFLFALGLLIAGMAKKSKIIGFLTFNSNWDYDLIFVMIGAILVNTLLFWIIFKKDESLKIQINQNNSQIDLKLVVGSAFFGLGWGLVGLCPGPAIVLFPFYITPISLIFFPSLLLGMSLVNYYENIQQKQKIQ